MALRLKPLPRNPDIALQRKLLTQPETNPTGHVPLEDARTFPFEPRPDEPSRVNAWWLAEASWLAYTHGEKDVARVFSEQTGMDCRPVSNGDTESYLAHNAEFAVLLHQTARE